jgi:hypothetical protein
MAVTIGGPGHASAATTAGVHQISTRSGLLPPGFEAFGDPVDVLLNQVLPHPDVDPNRGGEDPTELNLACSPDTGTCTRVPGHGSDSVESTYTTQVPIPPDTAPHTEHGPDRHHRAG